MGVIRAADAVTLVVPVRNEADTLASFLADLDGQTRQPDAVILCDGGSTDGSVDVLRGWAAQHSHVSVIALPQGFPGRTRNAGARAACTPWVAFADAGTRVPADWLAELVARRDRGDAPDIVYGSYEPDLRTFAQRSGAVSFVAPRRAVDGGYLRGPSTASMLIRRQAWEDLGGFPEDLRAAEDLVFFDRAAQRGTATAYAPQAIVQWSGPATFRATYRRFRAFSDHTLRAGLWRSWHRSVFAFYGAAAVACALALAHHPAWLACLAIGLASRVVNSMRKRRPPFGPAIPRTPGLVLGVAAAIVTADLAMFAGSLDYARRR